MTDCFLYLIGEGPEEKLTSSKYAFPSILILLYFLIHWALVFLSSDLKCVGLLQST